MQFLASISKQQADKGSIQNARVFIRRRLSLILQCGKEILMKLPLFLAVGLLPFLQFSAKAADDVIPIWNFAAKQPSYGYEGWQDLGAVSSKEENGLTIQAPANGGFGLFFNDLLDLESASTLIVRLTVLPGNTEERLMLKFHAADSKQAVWYIPLSGYSQDEATDITLDLTKPDKVLQSEPLDMGLIRQIQVQGTFTPGAKVHLNFESFGAKQK
jgi:hypothetical protein